MSAPIVETSRRLARPGAVLLAVLALPLLAPTCSGQGTGLKAFSKGSIVIPMDACYQGTSGATPAPGCPGAADAGDVVKAYGLVYTLVRNNIPVYWVIEPTKTSLTGLDLTVQFAGGAPVGKYSWATGTAGAMPPNNSGTTISYMGGPFVVDGSDFAAANAVLQAAGVKAVFGAAGVPSGSGAVNLHVSGVAFQGFAAKVLSGGWASGGATAPKLALLNIPGGDGRYADHVLEGYLVRSGLAPGCVMSNPPCADPSAGTASPSGHGTIYDRLEAADFLPPTCATDANCPAGSLCTTVTQAGTKYCDWKSTNLFQYGYKVLWLPHWTGPNSCTGTLNAGYVCGTGFGGCTFAGGDACSCVHNCTGNLTADQLDAVLATAGAFVASGNDVFGECAGLGTLEGVYSTGTSTVNATYGDGSVPSRFQTGNAGFPANGGMFITTGVTGPACTGPDGTNAPGMDCSGGEFYRQTYYASPFLQVGDFPYTPVSGAITEFRPAANNGSAYLGDVVSLIARVSGGNRLDYFTLRPAAEPRGNVVYLGGHDYSGFQSGFQAAGTRLVLNTLFNLASACVATGAPCSTGLLGACGQGTMGCDGSGNPVCVQSVFPAAESCNGLDDDCNGVVDDGIAPRACYSAGSGCTPSGGSFTCTGVCRAGTQTCVAGSFGACTGEVTPSAEVCNGLDDDCNGAVDDAVPPPGGVAACYTGPGDTRGVGVCRDGAWTCSAGTWACAGEKLPGFELCEPPGADENCDGQVDENCACVPGTTQPCYSGPAGTAGIGACRAGEQSCTQVAGQPAGVGAWGACTGEVKPSPETCNGVDDDCNGTIDDGGACDQCTTGATRPCYTGPAATRGVGVCQDGVETCAAGKWSGSCAGQVVPSQELCNGLDDDCDGTPDAGAVCNPGLSCLNGVCTFPSCGTPESSCGPGYVCTGTTCGPAPCPTGPCPAGQVCQSGACSDPCAGKSCAPGSFCSGGTCTGGGCLATGCPAGQLCLSGACAPDPCAGVTCPAGTFCRGGDCVQACAFVSCALGERCNTDGFCVAEPCSGKTCPAGQICQGGSCVDDPCAGKGCGAGQVCQGGLCTDDPCAGVTCPAGQCIRGQCFASNNPTGDYQPPKQTSGGKSGGCGCGGGLGEAGPAALLLAFLGPLRLRRRRRDLGALCLPALCLGAAALLAACGGSKKAPTNPDGTPCEACGTSACVDVKFDAAHCGTCAHACAAGEVCVDAVCGPGSAVAPYLRAASPAPVASGTEPTFTIDGERFQAGAKLRVAGVVAPAELSTTGSGTQLSAQVSLAGAPTGKLTLRVVNPDRVVSNLYSVDVVTPTPVITSVSPPSALAGTELTVTVAGIGFTPYSVCVVQVAGQPDAGLPTTVGSSSLDCDLDLRLVPVGTIHLLVQNEGGVRSGTLPFEVTAGTPTLVSVSPSAGQPGDVPRLLLTGTGFTPGCVAQFGQGGTFRSLATTYVAATRLQADLALAGDLPGTYAVRVFADASHVSGTVPFTVDPTAPVATSLSLTPANPRIGDVGVLLDFGGSGFEATCAVELQKPGGGGAWTAAGSTAVLSATSVRGTADMTGAPGTWYAHVHCPLGDTAAFPFQVQDNVAVLTSVAPAGGPQGTLQSLAVSGSNFASGVALELSGVGAPTLLTISSSTSTSIAASANLAGYEAGNYVLRAQNPGAGFSNGLAFAVTPGAPTLSSVAVSGGGSCAVQSGTPTAVTLSGANFAAGQSAVHASSALVADVDLSALAGTTVTVQNQATILVSLDTTGVVPGDYCVSVWNPGSPSVQKSGKKPFKVGTSASDCATPPAACP